MPKSSVGTIIENYKNAVKELATDPNPGKKAIVVYGGYMGKSYNTRAAFKELEIEDDFNNLLEPFLYKYKEWVEIMIKNSKKNFPVFVFDIINNKAQENYLKKIPEYKELIESIPSGNFGFTLSKPRNIQIGNSKKKETIPAGFFKIKSNLIFIVGYSVPEKLISIMPSYNFNFEPDHLLLYVHENIDNIFPEYETLDHEARIEMFHVIVKAYKEGFYSNSIFGFNIILDAFYKRESYELIMGKEFNKDQFIKNYLNDLKIYKERYENK